MKLDLLLKNGNIYTMEFEGKKVQALGIKDGKIVFAGQDKDAEAFESSETVDLGKKAVIPGMADSHMHMYAYCQNQTFVNLEQAESIDELISIMKKKAGETPKGSWIKGVNFD